MIQPKMPSPETPVSSLRCAGVLFVLALFSAILLLCFNAGEQSRSKSAQYLDGYENEVMKSVVAKQVADMQIMLKSGASEDKLIGKAKSQVSDIEKYFTEIEKEKEETQKTKNRGCCTWTTGNHMEHDSTLYPVYRGLVGFLTMVFLLSVAGLFSLALFCFKVLKGNPCEFLNKLLEYKPENKEDDKKADENPVPSGFAQFISAVGAVGVIGVAASAAFYPVFHTQPNLPDISKIALQLNELNQTASQVAQTAGNIKSDTGNLINNLSYLQTIDLTMQSMVIAVSGVVPQLKKLNQNTSHVANTFKGTILKQNNYFQANASATQRIENSMDGVAAHTGRINLQLVGLDKHLSYLQHLQPMASATKDIATGIGGEAAHTGGIYRSLIGLDGIGGSFDEIRKIMSNIATTSSNVLATTKEVNTQISGVAGQVRDTGIQVGQVAGHVSQVADQVRNTSHQVRNTSRQVRNTSRQVQDTGTQVSGVAGQVRDTSTQVSQVASYVSQAADQIQKTGEQISGVANTVQQTSTQVSQVAEHVSQAADQVQKTGKQVAIVNSILVPTAFRMEDMAAKQVVTRPPYKVELPVSVAAMDAICNEALRFDEPQRSVLIGLSHPPSRCSGS